MAITIKKYNSKWRIAIESENWEFEDLKELQNNLDILLKLKDKFGNIK